MSFLLKNTIHGVLADSLYSEILSRRSNYYYCIGRVLEWNDPDIPDTPIDNYDYEYQTRNGIISTKKITLSDISYVIPRVDWASGVVYDQYDPDYTVDNPASSGAISLKSSNFYVLTDNFNVYKCLSNNGGSASTVKPTGTDPIVLSTPDGYVWKFMYTIPLSIRNKFLTTIFMPVQKSVLNAFYSNGEVDRVVIDNPGIGYSGNDAVQLTVSGQFAASPNLIGSVSLVQGNAYVVGSGTAFVRDFYAGNTIFFTSNSNTYTVQNVFSNTVIVLTSSYLGSNVSGSNYKNYSKNSNVTAILAPVLNSSGTFLDVKILNKGNNYVTANVVIDNFGNSGTGLYNTSADASLIPVVYNGSIDRILIADPGIGYRTNTQTYVSVIGDGVGAAFTPYVNNQGQVEDIIIENRGVGYTYLDMEIIGGGTGANAYPELSYGDLDTSQSTVELAAIPGAIYNIKVTSFGNNYSNANVVVTGDGTGFLGIVNISNTNTISNVTVINPGSGYTYANVIINGSGSGANAYAILSPQGGHGSNAVKELFADTIMLFSTINNERNQGIDVSNDYRQIGIIKDIKQFNNSRAFTSTIGSTCYLANLSSVSGLTRDTVLQLSSDATKKFEVIETTSNNQALILDKNNYPLTASTTLYEPNTDSTYTITSIAASPTINKFTGDLIYIDNRTSVSYSDQQLVTLRTVIRF